MAAKILVPAHSSFRPSRKRRAFSSTMLTMSAVRSDFASMCVIDETSFYVPPSPPGLAEPSAPNAAMSAVTRPLASVEAPGMLNLLATLTPHSPPESLPASWRRLISTRGKAVGFGVGINRLMVHSRTLQVCKPLTVEQYQLQHAVPRLRRCNISKVQKHGAAV